MRTGFTPEQIESIVNRFKRYGCDAESLGHRDVLAIIEQLRVENERYCVAFDRLTKLKPSVNGEQVGLYDGTAINDCIKEFLLNG